MKQTVTIAVGAISVTIYSDGQVDARTVMDNFENMTPDSADVLALVISTGLQLWAKVPEL